jgi:hypothetical protein
MIVAYFGPESTLPIVSFLAAVIGQALTSARIARSWLLGWVRAVARKRVE